MTDGQNQDDGRPRKTNRVQLDLSSGSARSDDGTVIVQPRPQPREPARQPVHEDPPAPEPQPAETRRPAFLPTARIQRPKRERTSDGAAVGGNFGAVYSMDKLEAMDYDEVMDRYRKLEERGRSDAGFGKYLKEVRNVVDTAIDEARKRHRPIYYGIIVTRIVTWISLIAFIAFCLVGSIDGAPSYLLEYATTALRIFFASVIVTIVLKTVRRLKDDELRYRAVLLLVYSEVGNDRLKKFTRYSWSSDDLEDIRILAMKGARR